MRNSIYVDKNDELFQKKVGEIASRFIGVEPYDCKTIEQLELVEHLLMNFNPSLINIPIQHKPRDTKHYNDDEVSYMNNLKKAFELFEKYNPNGGMPILRQNFKELMYVGLSKPMTTTEARKFFIKDQIYTDLIEVGISNRVAARLSKQIADYLFNNYK